MNETKITFAEEELETIMLALNDYSLKIEEIEKSRKIWLLTKKISRNYVEQNQTYMEDED